MSDFNYKKNWEARNKELALLWDQFKSDIAFVHKDYDFFDLEKELYRACPIHCGLRFSSMHFYPKEYEHQKSFETFREQICEIVRERLREKLCENICENFPELRAISYDSGGASVSQRNRIESEIVLLNTRSEMNAIRCVSIPFDENVPAYYAISYRWGQHPEWKAQTPNYVASITSISQGNLIKLCRYNRDRILYMWIDVICINQSDRAHKKMAIKNMSNIYGKAKRIIGVPDLRYCKDNPFMEDVSREDIEAAIIKMSNRRIVYTSHHTNITMLLDRNEPGTYHGFRLDVSELPKEMKPWNEGNTRYRDLDDYTRIKHQVGDIEKGAKFVTQVILEWANRVWVVSERVIGNKGGKLLIHILRSNTVFYPMILFRHIQNVKWTLAIPEDAFRVMLDCDSDKYIDRLYAILPHTRYKYAMEKLVNEDITVNDEEDLKWLLFDILDTADKNDFLKFLIRRRKEFSIMLPLPVSEEHSEEKVQKWSHEIEESKTSVTRRFIRKFETLSQNGNRVLKVSCPFICEYRPDNAEESQLSSATDASKVLLLQYISNLHLYGWQYQRSEDEELWKFVEEKMVVNSLRWEYGESLIFQYTKDGFVKELYI